MASGSCQLLPDAVWLPDTKMNKSSGMCVPGGPGSGGIQEYPVRFPFEVFLKRDIIFEIIEGISLILLEKRVQF